MSMTSTANAAGLSLGQAQAAAEALARVLPTGTPLTPLLAQGSEVRETGRAVVATFVGSVAADLAVVLLEAPQLVDEGADGSPVVALEDVLQPALEAASDTLGAGVLDDARAEDAAELFSDPATSVSSGPFVLKEWRKGDRLIYEANPKYKGTNKPFIQKVIVIVWSM